MFVDKMTVYKMPVYKMKVYKMTKIYLFIQKVCRKGVYRQNDWIKLLK